MCRGTKNDNNDVEREEKNKKHPQKLYRLAISIAVRMSWHLKGQTANTKQQFWLTVYFLLVD